jgi:hypothetical protein
LCLPRKWLIFTYIFSVFLAFVSITPRVKKGHEVSERCECDEKKLFVCSYI